MNIKIMLNIKTNEKLILFNNIIFHGAKLWNWLELQNKFPNVLNYTKYLCGGSEDKETVKNITMRYKENYPYDNRLDAILNQGI